jgi:hypothetical protein
MEKVLEVFDDLITRPSGSRTTIVNNILGVDILDTFPEWFDVNAHRIPGRYA